MSGTSPAHIVCVYGMWMNGVEASFMRRRLQDRYGLNAHQWHYRTARASMHESVTSLRAYVTGELAIADDGVCHFVGHSLGGLVVLKMLAEWPAAPQGNVVCLGTPMDQSTAARVATVTNGESLMGDSIDDCDFLNSDHWRNAASPRAIGAIAGTHCIGVGRGQLPLQSPNDGSVSVAETKADLLTDHLQVAATHSGLVASREITDQVAHFVTHGRFRAAVSEGSALSI